MIDCPRCQGTGTISIRPDGPGPDRDDNCPKCEGTGQVSWDEAFPFTAALLQDAESVHVTWSFDEQQADPVHHNFTLEKLKNELRQILEII